MGQVWLDPPPSGSTHTHAHTHIHTHAHTLHFALQRIIIIRIRLITVWIYLGIKKRERNERGIHCRKTDSLALLWNPKTPYSYTVSLERNTARLDKQKYICMHHLRMHAYTVCRPGVCAHGGNGKGKKLNKTCGFGFISNAPKSKLGLFLWSHIHLCMCASMHE